jgi:hypothetical protein
MDTRRVVEDAWGFCVIHFYRDPIHDVDCPVFPDSDIHRVAKKKLIGIGSPNLKQEASIGVELLDTKIFGVRDVNPTVPVERERRFLSEFALTLAFPSKFPDKFNFLMCIGKGMDQET